MMIKGFSSSLLKAVERNETPRKPSDLTALSNGQAPHGRAASSYAARLIGGKIYLQMHI